MQKKFSFSLKWWNGKYEDKKIITREIKQMPDGSKKTIEKTTYNKVRITFPIKDIQITPRNEVEIELEGEKDFFKMTYGEVMLSQYIIDPVNSAFINQWNITLPLIAYKEDNKNGNDSEI